MAEQKTKCVCKNIWFWVVVGIIVVLGLGGFFYYKFTFVPCADPSCYEGVDYTVDVKPEELPAGVEVTNLENGNRLVKNINDGYQIEVGSDKYLYKDEIEGKNLVVQDFSGSIIDYSGTDGCYLIEETTKGDVSKINEETKAYCENREDCTDFKIKEAINNGITWFEVRYFGEYVGAGLPKLKTYKDDMVYTLYFKCDDQKFINDILNNFSFNKI